MKRVYQISVSPGAPTLRILPTESYAPAFKELRGQSLSGLSPDRPFLGTLDEHRGWNQFYRVAPGGFAISEEAWDHCTEMYSVVTNNDVELLSVVAGQYDLR